VIKRPAVHVVQQESATRLVSTWPETVFLALITICVVFELDALLWIYTGANSFTLTPEQSDGARYYSLVRWILMLFLVATISWRGSWTLLIYQALPIVIVWAYFFLSVFWSNYFVDSLRSYAVSVMQILVAFAICSGVDSNRALMRMRWVAIGLLTINIGFLGIFPDLALDTGGYGGVYEGALRGIFPGKNNFGTNVATFVAILLASSIKGGRLKVDFANCFWLLVCFVLLVFIRSATSLVAAFLVVVILLWQTVVASSLPTYSHRLLASITIIGILALVLLNSDAIFEALSVELGRDPTFSGRTKLWEFAFKRGQEQELFGYGFNGFWQPFIGPDEYLKRSGLWQVGRAHNGFIEAFLFGGWVGAGLVISLFGYMLIHSVVSLARSPMNSATILALMTTCQIAFQNSSESLFPNDIHFAGTMMTISLILLRRNFSDYLGEKRIIRRVKLSNVDSVRRS